MLKTLGPNDGTSHCNKMYMIMCTNYHIIFITIIMLCMNIHIVLKLDLELHIYTSLITYKIYSYCSG